MDGCTIDIADFRSHAIARIKPGLNRVAGRPRGFEIAEPDPASRDRKAENFDGAVLQDDPTVYDIGIAREAESERHRAVFRPISNQRKAKVLRFRDEVPVPLRMRAEERRGADSRPGMPDGPSNQPPAA